MNIDEAYPSKYIKESDLQGQPRVLTIARVSVETLDQSSNETKPVVYFQGAQKGLVLNVTNKNVFVLLYGKETNNWNGRQIELYPSQTDFRGEVVACIRCRAPGAVGALGALPVGGSRIDAAAPLQEPPPVQSGQSLAAEIDDEIPF